ncbi:MAG: hypothetical protein WA704_29080, partial [Pseudolabrys sp.]
MIKTADRRAFAAMSALGQKQTCAMQNVMSALTPIADMCGAKRDVRFVPIADIAPAANNEAADYRIAAFLQSMRRASGHFVHLKFSIEQHLVAAQPTGKAGCLPLR